MFYSLQFNFNVKYEPGQDNREADCLSRSPVLKEFESTDELRIVNLTELDEIKSDQRKLSTDSLKILT